MLRALLGAERPRLACGVVLKININEYFGDPSPETGQGVDARAARTAPALPCLLVTTASAEEDKPLGLHRLGITDELVELVVRLFRPSRDHFASIRTLKIQGVRRPL